jgi:adenylate cyclase
VDETRRLSAILMTDTVGYSAATQADEAGTLALLREQEELVRPVVAAYRGREVKSTGDGFLMEFESALKATQCAIDLQRRIYERNALPDVRPFQIRIGIHLGDVELRGGDIFGDAVNIASRVEPLAEPGGICVSGAVREQVWNKLTSPLVKLPSTELKGIRAPVDLYRVVLPWISGAGPRREPGLPRLAVLPFSNISPDPNDAYFADGLTEELIAVLSRIRDLRVLARTSVAPYKTTQKLAGQIADELGVSHFLEGSVRKAGDRLRITLQLIDAQTQEPIWAETFNRELTDVFAIQTEIAEHTAKALALGLGGVGRPPARRQPTEDLSAYEEYLKGVHAWQRTEAGFSDRAIAHFEEAIRRDPRFSLAYAQYASVLLQDLGDRRSGTEVAPKIESLVTKALELDPTLAEAHVARGNFAMQWELDWDRAETEFREGLRLNPSGGTSHAWYGLLLEAQRRFDEAIPQYQLAIGIDPGYWVFPIRLAATYLKMRDYASAIGVAAALVREHPDSPWHHIFLARTLLEAGRLGDAEKEVQVAEEMGRGQVDGTDPFSRNRLIRSAVEAAKGNLVPTRELVNDLTEKAKTGYVPLTVIAALHARLGEDDRALELIERDLREGDHSLWFYGGDYDFRRLRKDPRFRELYRKIRLPAPE